VVPASAGGTSDFLRADGTWNTPGGGGDVTGPAGGTTDGDIAVFDDTTGKLIRLGTVTEADVADNTTHRGSAGTDHSDVGLNNTHRGLTNEHIDWTAAGAETIHTNHYIEGGAGTDTTAIHTGDTDAVPNAMLADMAGFSVKAKPTTAAGVPTDLVVGTNTVLGRVAGDVVAAQVVDGQIATNTVTNAKIVQMAANTVKANATAGAANQADLAVGTNEVVGRVAGNIVAAQLVNDQIATATVVATGKLSATGTKNSSTFLRGDDTWDVPPGAGGISTGTGDPTGGSDGDFYYDTVAQALWYNDTAVWEIVGVAVDDVTIEVDGTNGLQLIDAGTIATTKLSATGTKNSTTFLRGDDTWDVPIDTPKPTLTKSLTLELPTGTELFPIFYTPVAITFTEFEHFIQGTVNVEWQIMWGATADAAGTATHSTIVTSSTSGVTTAPTTDPTIPADSYIWLDTSAISGTPDKFHVTITYTED
jgi:hypothetical protein